MRHWIDRLTEGIAPRWTLKRERARIAGELLRRHYEAATIGPRTQNWKRTSTDANAAIGGSNARLRDYVRDLVRNNPLAENALSTIVDQVVGWGIMAAEAERHEAWKRWSETTACDADGRLDFAGLQRLAMRTIAESGEVLVRRLYRSADAGLPLPIQLQVLEPDFLDMLKDHALPGGGRVIQGVELDSAGRRIAYWLFPEHPGARSIGSGSRLFGSSQRIPASDVVHVYKQRRPGQVRGVTEFASSLLTFKEFDELADATLVKQKIAACLAVITTDVDGTGPTLGKNDADKPLVDTLYPGMVLNGPAGRGIEVVQPPTTREYPDFAENILRSIAAGLGITHEDLTGNYTDLPFSAARMSRLRAWARANDWRWSVIVPQLLDPVWSWAMEASAIMGLPVIERTDWTAPPLPMIEPDKEGLAYQRNIRTGIMSLSEALRERGYNPRAALEELASDFGLLDALGLLLDSDPRKMTQAGQLQGAAADAGAVRSDRELRALLTDVLAALEAPPQRSTNGRRARANGHGGGIPEANQ